VSQPPQQDLYPEVLREDVRPYLPRHARSVLDVGCGPGGFGKTLRSVLGPDARVVGVEAVPSQAAVARTGHGYDEVVDGYFPEALGDRSERFDLVCYNDVLEHVVDPWDLLRQTRSWLDEGGAVIALIPSIQFAPAVWALLKGRWDYTDTGTLDRTHLRFFTRATMVEMFEQAGYRVLQVEGVNPYAGSWPHDPPGPRKLAKRFIPRLMGDFRYMHFMVHAEPVRP
jgi:2-polyprenyl-3-methyl-5-hydroxy-6-metoxy-1,4-benzoquinol methylase